MKISVDPLVASTSEAISEYNQELAEAQVTFDLMKLEARKKFEAFLEKLGPENVKLVFDMVYWETLTQQTTLLSLCGLGNKNNIAKEMVQPRRIWVMCRQCHQSFYETVMSRDARKRVEVDRNKNRCWCDTCNRIAYEKRMGITQKREPNYSAMPYADYLETDQWLWKRRKRLKIAGNQCELCKATEELHVHHKTYARRGQEKMTDLVVLCSTCHGFWHDKLA